MREKQPRLLVLWGKYGLCFELSEPEAHRRDVPKAELHVLDAGHFALDTAADQFALLIQGFMVDSHKLESSRKLSVGDGNARDWRIRTIPRKRYQAGSVRKRGENAQTQYWEGTWREYVRGEAKPQRRSAKLGLIREMSKGGAKRKHSELLREVNSPDHQPESSLTLDKFWSKFEELVLPKKRYSTRK